MFAFPCAQVRARFVERFTIGAPSAGGEVQGPAIQGMEVMRACIRACLQDALKCLVMQLTDSPSDGASALQEKCDWVEKFVRLGAGPIDAARSEHSR